MLDDETARVLRSAGANIRRLRSSRALTQAALAEVGCEPNYLQKIEYGTVAASIPTLVRVAKALGVPVPSLFRPSPSPKRRVGRPRRSD